MLGGGQYVDALMSEGEALSLEQAEYLTCKISEALLEQAWADESLHKKRLCLLDLVESLSNDSAGEGGPLVNAVAAKAGSTVAQVKSLVAAFLAQADRDAARGIPKVASLWVEVHGVAQWIERKLLAAIEGQIPRLVEAAQSSETPPIDHLLEVLPLTDHEQVERFYELEGILQTRLEAEGLRICREIQQPIRGSAEPFVKRIYYRPGERILLDAVEDPHPVILATVVETQRYIDALVAYADDANPGRAVWVWRGAAGLPALERADTGKTQCRIGVLRLSSVPEEERARVIEPSRNTGITATVNLATGSLPIWMIADGGSGAVHIIVDDVEAGFPPNDPLPDDVTEALFQQAAQLFSASDDLAPFQPAQNFVDALLRCRGLAPGSIMIVPDAHHFLTYEANSPGGREALHNIAALKDIYHHLLGTPDKPKIILLCADLTLPKDLREEVLRVDLPLPGRRELFVHIRDVAPEEPEEHIVRLAEEAAGMTLAEVRAVLARAAATSRGDVNERRLTALREAKRRHIARSPALELVETSSASSLGGMELFEEWLESRRRAFVEPEQARRAGIDRPPRGVLLLGIPGSGKSLAAKVIARTWGLPLVRLDMGSLRNSWVGSSEARVREALRVIEAMAPCVMWIDEIDKGAAQGEGGHEHSVDLNIRATLLTWMQENRYPVFIVATANRFAALPPELTRAGRFDARFFFGCPGPGGRQDILKIHLHQRKQDAGGFDLEALTQGTHGFTGAEIEQVVLDSLYTAFNLEQPLTSQLLLKRVASTQPLIKSAGRALDELWTLVEDGRVEMASGEMLTRSQVARLVDPHLYRPIYCHLEHIEGFERHYSKATRLLMSSPFGGPAAVVMETGEPEWLYVQTNFRRSDSDIGTFKILDQFETLELNSFFDTLVVEHALETIYLETEAVERRFCDSPMLSAYQELFRRI